MYNYERFRAREYNLLEFPGPLPGQKAPDFEATTLDGQRVRLSDYFGPLIVLETGSISCPMYVSHIPSMNELARRYPEVTFIVLYTREAHPGTRIASHRSLEDKVVQARRLKQQEPENRIVLVDSLDGSAHQAYGGLPNFVYVIDGTGTVLFRADWNQPGALAEVLARNRRGESLPHKATHLRPPSPRTAIRVLRRAGWDAFADLVLAVPNLSWQHFRAALRRRSSGG